MVWLIDVNSQWLRVNGKYLVRDFPVVKKRCDFHLLRLGRAWLRKEAHGVPGSSSLGCTPILRNGHSLVKLYK